MDDNLISGAQHERHRPAAPKDTRAGHQNRRTAQSAPRYGAIAIAVYMAIVMVLGATEARASGTVTPRMQQQRVAQDFAMLPFAVVGRRAQRRPHECPWSVYQRKGRMLKEIEQFAPGVESGFYEEWRLDVIPTKPALTEIPLDLPH